VELLVLPTLGPLHLIQPRYNALTPLEIIRSWQPDALLLASYSSAGFTDKVWRDEEELAFFHLVPYAERAGLSVQAIGPENSELLRAEADRFREYLNEMEKGQTYLEEEKAWQRELESVLREPLWPARFRDEVFLSALKRYLKKERGLFGEGPATGFREQRMEHAAEVLAGLPEGRYAVWVDLLDYPALLRRIEASPIPDHMPTVAERERALLDRAWLLNEEDDWGMLLEQLREVGSPEAGYLAAQIYLAAGQVADAAMLLEQISEGDFHEPEYLPGYLLARLGQVRDLLGERERALRAYRGVLALSWAPREAREIAAAGLNSPFRIAPN